MFDDAFKIRYTTIPFATSYRIHKKNTIEQDIITLSHKHKEIELMTILNGKAQIHIDTQSYEIEKGDIVIISPYLLHNTRIFANADFDHYCICFDIKIIPDEGLRNKLEKSLVKIPHIIKNNEQSAKELSLCLKNAYETHAMQKDGWELQVIGNLSIFWGLLKENKYISKNDHIATTNDICYLIIDYIEKNYTQKITSADAAKAFYMSKSYFCRIFKRNFGHCFQNYICMYRIEKAKILLKTTDTSISDISMQVGFNSFSFFSKMFKSYLGATPSEYRQADARE